MPRSATRAARWRSALASLMVAALLAPGIASAGARSSSGQPDAVLPETAGMVPQTAPAYVSLDLDPGSGQWNLARELLGRAGFPEAVDGLLGSVLADWRGDRPQPPASDPILGGEVGWILDEVPSPSTAPTATPAGATSAAVENPALAALATGFGSPSVTIVRPGDPGNAWEAVLRAFDRRATAIGAAVAESTYRDIGIRSFAPTAGGSGQAVARVGDALLFAPDAATVEPIVDTATGAAPSLADLPAIAESRARLATDVLLFGFADNARLAASAGPEWAEGLAVIDPALAREVDAAMGSEPPQALQGELGFALWADKPGLRFDAVASSPLDDDPVFAAPENVDLALDERVPADTLFLFAGEGTAVRSFFAGLLPSIAMLLNDLLGPDEAPATPEQDQPLTTGILMAEIEQANRIVGFDLQADLVDELVGEFALSASVSSLLAGNGTVSAIVASDVRDGARVRGTLDKIAALVRERAETMEVATRPVGNDLVHVVRNPRSPGMPAIEFGIVGGQMLAGVGSGIDDYVAGPAAPLAADERYRRVMATLPAEHYQVSYVNVGEAVDLIDLVLGVIGQANADPAATPPPRLGERIGAIEAFAQVGYQEEGDNRLSAILYIGPGPAVGT